MTQHNEGTTRRPCFNDFVLQLQKLKAGITLFGNFRSPSPPLDFSTLSARVQEATRNLGLSSDEEQRMINFVQAILTKAPSAREEQPRELVQLTQLGLRTVPGQQARPPEPSARKGVK